MNNVANWPNNRGQVVGFSDLPGDVTYHGFLWQQGRMTDLGTLPGDTQSEAVNINDDGQIVGLSCDASGNCRAVLWQGGALIDLNTLLPPKSSLYFIEAWGINSSGQIVGSAYDKKSGETVAVLATPNDSAPARFSNRSSERIILPEYVRQQLRRQRDFGRRSL